jgi:ribosome-associated translation inhibitor RaiA
MFPVIAPVMPASARGVHFDRAMKLEITFKGLARSESLESWIRTWAEKLERVYPRLVEGEVTIEAPHRHHRQGRRFEVKLRLGGPEAEVVVSHDGGDDGAHQDPYVAVRDAFRAARHQLDHQVQIAHEVRA